MGAGPKAVRARASRCSPDATVKNIDGSELTNPRLSGGVVYGLKRISILVNRVPHVLGLSLWT